MIEDHEDEESEIVLGFDFWSSPDPSCMSTSEFCTVHVEEDKTRSRDSIGSRFECSRDYVPLTGGFFPLPTFRNRSQPRKEEKKGFRKTKMQEQSYPLTIDVHVQKLRNFLKPASDARPSKSPHEKSFFPFFFVCRKLPVL